MNYKNISRGIAALLMVLLVSAFSYEAPVAMFSPVGTWEWSAPDVPDGYQEGKMIIAKNDKGYAVTLAIGEYYKIEAEEVEYKKKSIKFTIWVESEEVNISGTFDGDEFNGTVSYFEGDVDMKASRASK